MLTNVHVLRMTMTLASEAFSILTWPVAWIETRFSITKDSRYTPSMDGVSMKELTPLGLHAWLASGLGGWGVTRNPCKVGVGDFHGPCMLPARHCGVGGGGWLIGLIRTLPWKHLIAYEVHGYTPDSLEQRGSPTLASARVNENGRWPAGPVPGLLGH